jgi:nucleoside-triphosphatase
MNIFLTGEIQVGKSTVIEKTLALLNKTSGGFKTYFGPDRGSEDRWLYLNAASEAPVFTKEKGVVRFSQGWPIWIDTNKFDTYGVELIRAAKAGAEVLIMDECGNFERAALKFQREIIKSLDGPKPVLGVIKLSSSGFTDVLRNHPNVKLITVTRENRDELPKMITRFFEL